MHEEQPPPRVQAEHQMPQIAPAILRNVVSKTGSVQWESNGECVVARIIEYRPATMGMSAAAISARVRSLREDRQPLVLAALADEV